MKTILTAALFCVGLGSAATAATINFSDFDEGDILGLDADLGGGVIADIAAIGGVAEAVVFDTDRGTVSTGNDPDLTSPFTNAEDSNDRRAFGNALIVQENATGGPDDVVGGSLIFSFDSLWSFASVFLLDAEVGTSATLFNGTDEVASFTLDRTNESETGGNPNNNEFTLLGFADAVGDTLRIDFAGSGALGEFEVSAVPLPAGFPLLIAGLGAFAWMRRRQQAA
ncbi:VPLPA-CTERM sorting domain-containing protein [uncultured Tateyamaria sp.]|uniref:VPLPA-CTERM sorting domain-containing protein n=1 Tax=uncultured Tateyamaria sp. TaxID=455651 RepID=UPI0026226DAA|nr:VPLPA-CTERM sorting domain-containing protein [uncultured Tateyamaria sp.]